MLSEDSGTLYIHNIPPRSIARCAATMPGACVQVGQQVLVMVREAADRSATFRIIAADLTDDDIRLYQAVCRRWDERLFAGRRWGPVHVADLLGTLRRLEQRIEAAKAELAPILLSFAEET